MTASRPYVVQEFQGPDGEISRWTSEIPGKTGPHDLEEVAHLQDPDKCKVYWVVPVNLVERS